jgi:hypothetical protein
VDTGGCSIRQQPIQVGQTVSGARVGAPGQTLVFNPANCGGNGPRPPGPVEYTATLTYLQ